MDFPSTFRSKGIRVRFLVTLAANGLRFALSFFSGMFIARALGPSDFGDFNFLLTSFLSIGQLLDMGTSTAFYTFISRRKRASSFYAYYAGWMAVQFALALLLATLLLPEFLRQKIWLGHGREIVVLSLFAGFGMNQLWQAVSQAGESIRATVTVQAYNILISLVYILTILVAIRLDALSVSSLFVFIAVEFAFFAFLLARRLRGELVEGGGGPGFKEVFNEFKAYCYPLAGYSVVSFVYSFADNWLLQRFAGATEQGFYAIGYRFTFLSSIAVASMLQVLWKEVAEAVERHDLDGIRELSRKMSRAVYFLTAALSCFLVPFSREVIVWLVGPSYEGAALCMAIMLFFPVIQAVGQVSYTVLLASGHTVLYRNFGIIYMLISIPVTYFVIATPKGAYFGIPGLGLGATGLALKMVALGYIGTNVIVYLIARLYKWKFDFLYQLAVVALFVPAAFASKFVTVWFLEALLGEVSTPTLLSGSMLIYAGGTAAIIYLLPELTGLRREDMRALLDKIKAALRGEL